MSEPAAARSAEFPVWSRVSSPCRVRVSSNHPGIPFIERCEAAAAAGFSGIGLHSEIRPARSLPAWIPEMRAVLRNNGLALVEIEFLGGWAFSRPARGNLTITGRHRSGRRRARGPPGQRRRIQRRLPLDTEEALERAAKALRANADRLAKRGCSSPSSRFRGRRWPTRGSRSTCYAAPMHRMRAC